MKAKYLILSNMLLVACGSSHRMSVDESQVDIGYGSTKKGNLTMAVSQVKVDDKEVGGYSNMYDYLRGRVPGVNVIGTGRSAQIQIRGINSINCPTEPLILVDGVEISDLNMINPNDVKSVSVLKDASSSIYGSRGANGVILITMKR